MAMDLATLHQQLPQLEYYCERLYTAQVCSLSCSGAVPGSYEVTPKSYMQDPNERKQAEESLTPFGKSTDYIPHLRVCLLARHFFPAAGRGRRFDQCPKRMFSCRRSWTTQTIHTPNISQALVCSR